MARVGREDQVVIAGAIHELLDMNFGPPLHSLVIVGDTHELEKEMLDLFSVSAFVRSVGEENARLVQDDTDASSDGEIVAENVYL